MAVASPLFAVLTGDRHGNGGGPTENAVAVPVLPIGCEACSATSPTLQQDRLGGASNGSSNVRLETGRYPQVLGDTAESRNPTSDVLSGTGRHEPTPGSCSL